MQENRKKIAITFDDAPQHGVTDQILGILEKFRKMGDLEVTFFIQGNRIRTWHDVKTIRKIKKAGYEIGNHSWSHPRFCELSALKIWWELEKTDWLLFLLGIKTIGVRTSYGEQNKKIDRLLKKDIIK